MIHVGRAWVEEIHRSHQVVGPGNSVVETHPAAEGSYQHLVACWASAGGSLLVEGYRRRCEVGMEAGRAGRGRRELYESAD